MQQFSFDFGDPIFDLKGWQIGAQLITFENTYGLDPEATRLIEADGRYQIIADQLMWAGNQEKADGRAAVSAAPTDDGLELCVAATHTQKIRCTKLIVRGRANRFGYFHPIDASVPLSQPGEYRVDVTARFVDSEGKLWMGSRTSAGVVAPRDPPVIARGRRGIDDQAS